MFSKFDEEAKKVLVNMKKEMASLNHPYIGTEHLFLSILKYGCSSDISKLKEHGISYDKFRDELVNIVGVGSKGSPYYLYTPLLKSVIEAAILNSSDKGNGFVNSSELLMAIFDEGEGVAIRILIGMGVDLDSLYDSFYDESRGSSKPLMIDTFGVDLNKKASLGEIDPILGRDKEISRILEILSRKSKNNPLLIGDAGVGKTAIVEELARMIYSGKVGGFLAGKRIVSVSMASLVAGTKYRGEFEERIEKMISELEKCDDIILFIDEVHTLVGAGGAEGAIDASNILKPALARGKIRLIGATTVDEYKKFISDDKALCRRFQRVDIEETSLEVTKHILNLLAPIYERFHNVKLSDEVLDKIISLSDRYIYDRKMPDKAIDVLDEVCSRVRIRSFKNDSISKVYEELSSVKSLKNDAVLKHDFKLAMELKEKEVALESKKMRLECKDKELLRYSVTISDVVSVVEERSKVPIFGSLEQKSADNFRKSLESVIFGQDSAVNEMCKLFKRLRLGFNRGGRPYSFLFVGPTGVGKTMLVKEFCKACYGEDNFIRLDMSEFSEAHSVSKIIGSPPGYVGYSSFSCVLESVKDNPYSVILLDEIDKAHPDVLSLFFQILDEGRCKDSRGNVVRFDNTVIFMTSNVGFKNSCIGFDEKVKSSDISSFFGNEFINRVSKVISFSPLSEDVVRKLINSKISKLRKAYKIDGVSFSVSNDVISSLVDLCGYKLYGARRIDKVIEDNLESVILDKVYSGLKRFKISNIEAREVV